MTPPTPATPGTLIVDPSGNALDCARSLEEAVARLIGGEYHTIVVYGTIAGDDLGLVQYLAGTWPEFLRALTVTTDAVHVPARAHEQRDRRREHAADEGRIVPPAAASPAAHRRPGVAPKSRSSSANAIVQRTNEQTRAPHRAPR
ncbi:MAG TPA: hypothetical protein VF698_15720 [Thermoanaerobaculia bacterium]|jgi:hypothetical protein